MKIRIDLEWRTTVLTLILLPVLLTLGVWQLERAEEKLALASSWQQRQLLPPVTLSKLIDMEPGALAYRPVTLTGHFVDDRYLLLDNRIHRGRFGYEVVGLFALAQDPRLVLVNRGWTPGDPSRQQLPSVNQPEGVVTVTGHVYVAPGKPYLLADQVLEPGWPKRVQNLDLQKLAGLFDSRGGARLFPYPVRINAGAPGALVVDWQVVNVSAAKHRGYAVQWFAMAAALSVMFVVRSSNVWQLLRRNPRGAR